MVSPSEEYMAILQMCYASGEYGHSQMGYASGEYMAIPKWDMPVGNTWPFPNGLCQ